MSGIKGPAEKIGDIRQTSPHGQIVGLSQRRVRRHLRRHLFDAFTADVFTQRELRDYVEDARDPLLRSIDVSQIDIFGTQDETI